MKRYRCVGGPLDGRMTTATEMRPTYRAKADTGRYKVGEVTIPGGKYGDVADQYVDYNRAAWDKTAPKMVRLHRSLVA